MNAVKRMVLVPEEKYQRLLRLRVDSSNTNSIPSLSAEHAPSPSATSSNDKLTIDLILAGIPKQFKNEAKAVLDYIIHSNSIDWNAQGEIIIKDKVLNHTHLSDLIKHAMRNYTNFNPIGHQEFYAALKEIHVPNNLIGNTDYHAERIETQPNTKTRYTCKTSF